MRQPTYAALRTTRNGAAAAVASAAVVLVVVSVMPVVVLLLADRPAFDLPLPEALAAFQRLRRRRRRGRGGATAAGASGRARVAGSFFSRPSRRQRSLRRVGERLVVAARLTPQARTGRQAGRHVDPGDDGKLELRRGRAAVGDRDLGGVFRFGAVEGPDRLGAVGGGDRHPDLRAGAVGVALVVERDRHRDEFARRHRRDVGFAQAQDRLERRALGVVELALVRPHPAVLDEGLLAIGPNLADRRLQVDVRGRGADPEVDRTGTDHGGVFAKGRGQVGDGAVGRVLFPVVGGSLGPEAAGAGAGAAAEVGLRQGFGVPGEFVGARPARGAVTEAAARRQVPGRRLRARHGEIVKGFFESGVGLAGGGFAGWRFAGAVVEEDPDRLL